MSSGRWRKIGRIYAPAGDRPWAATHASVPIAESLDDDRLRIYFSTRDAQNRSHTDFIVIDIKSPDVILERASAPVLSPGRAGEFDDSGAMATWLTVDGDRRLLWYIGWNLGVTVPFRNSIGLATSEQGKTFLRFSDGPIVDRTRREPHFCASCCVLRDGMLWRMWYLSCTGWFHDGLRLQHSYHIKYAESDDGLEWQRDGRIAIDFNDPSEYAISRPSVLRDRDRWKMWYSHRGDGYRIGYAESSDRISIGLAGTTSRASTFPHLAGTAR